MKKILFLMLSLTLFSFEAYAKSGGEHCNSNYMGGGFLDTTAESMSVADVLKEPEDTYVMLHGHITKQIGKDMYAFSDGKDTMTVEIDDKYWRGQTVSPNDKLAIGGEVENDDGKMIVEVKSLHIVK